jgi:hypothetical protein
MGVKTNGKRIGYWLKTGKKGNKKTNQREIDTQLLTYTVNVLRNYA